MYTAAGTVDVEQRIKDYAPLVRRMAHHLAAKLPSSVQIDDIIQAGCGLVGVTSGNDGQPDYMPTLIADKTYVDLVMEVSERLGEWIVQAQQDGALTSRLPPEVILYTLFARACDPVLGFLKAGGQHSDEKIVEWVLSTCLDGLAARP